MADHEITIGQRVAVRIFSPAGFRWVEVLFVRGDIAIGKADGDGPMSELIFTFTPGEIATDDEVKRGEVVLLRENIYAAVRGTSDFDALQRALDILRAAATRVAP